MERQAQLMLTILIPGQQQEAQQKAMRTEAPEQQVDTIQLPEMMPQPGRLQMRMEMPEEQQFQTEVGNQLLWDTRPTHKAQLLLARIQVVERQLLLQDKMEEARL
jgi:hypothetical protein